MHFFTITELPVISTFQSLSIKYILLLQIFLLLLNIILRPPNVLEIFSWSLLINQPTNKPANYIV